MGIMHHGMLHVASHAASIAQHRTSRHCPRVRGSNLAYISPEQAVNAALYIPGAWHGASSPANLDVTWSHSFASNLLQSMRERCC